MSMCKNFVTHKRKTDVDISIVLNCHNEDLYIQSTLRSLNDSFVVANDNGIVLELISVLDSPTVGVQEAISKFSFAGLCDHRVVVVSHKSLGLSRNEGIKNSSGRYIVTADADDLRWVSEKWTSRNDLGDNYDLGGIHYETSTPTVHCRVQKERG